MITILNLRVYEALSKHQLSKSDILHEVTSAEEIISFILVFLSTIMGPRRSGGNITRTNCRRSCLLWILRRFKLTVDRPSKIVKGRLRSGNAIRKEKNLRPKEVRVYLWLCNSFRPSLSHHTRIPPQLRSFRQSIKY